MTTLIVYMCSPEKLNSGKFLAYDSVSSKKAPKHSKLISGHFLFSVNPIHRHTQR